MKRNLFKLVLFLFLISSLASEEAYKVKIDFNVRVKMRDGVELSADVYRPDAEGKFPVILSRTPYNKNGQRALEFGRYFGEHGYVYVEMDVRGRGDSDGVFVPYRNDGRDGYDAIEWCANQPWSTGKVGTIGGSYLGKIQWLTALLKPPHLITMIVMVSPSDPFVEWQTGLPLPMDISWYHVVGGRMLQNEAAVDWSKIHWHLPIYTMDEAAGRPNPYWKQMVQHSQLDEWWQPLRYQDKFDKIKVPVFHISGWYDDEQIGTLINFMGMTSSAATEEIRRSQKLLMGPWPHGLLKAKQKLGDIDFGPASVVDFKALFLRWFDYWLKGIDNGIMKEAPVKVFIMGENKWLEEKSWPIPNTKWVSYYLHSKGRANSLYGDGELSLDHPKDEPYDTYTYDPKNPVPFITEPSFAQIGGPDDYRPIERRDDVLVYDSKPIEKEITICGPIKLKLYAASSAPDTDFMGKLLDVWENGFAQRLTDGMIRARFRNGMDKPALIEPDKVYLYDIDLWNTCQTFKKGHRIRLEISSSAFPKYDRNPNTGEPLGMTTNMKIAKQKIYHNLKYPSHVILPLLLIVPGWRVKKKKKIRPMNLLLVLFIFTSISLADNNIDFDKFFYDATMRIDYYHIGDAKEEFITLDKIYKQGVWAGSKINLLDLFNNGRYFLKVYDYDTNQLIFSKGFDSYFGEYKTSPPAIKGIKRTYHESLLIPYPKRKIQFTIELRDRGNVLRQIFNEVIDPESIYLINESPQTDVKVIELIKNGEPSEKVDLAFIAEGYTKDEEGKFNKDLGRLTEVFFSQQPYKSLKDKFNVYGIFKASSESGSDEPSYGSFKNTVLNTTYDSLGSERYLLTEDNRALRDIASVVPYDALIVLINSNRYGGGGIYNQYATVISDNQWTNYILIHEFGHSFAGLADEYYTSSVAYSEFYPAGVEPTEPNITALLDKDNLKWKDLVSAGIELPVPWEKEAFEKMDLQYQKVRQELNEKIAKRKREKAPSDEIKKLQEESEKLSAEHAKRVDEFLSKSKYLGKVGAFEGAGYAAKGLYRPMVDCIMFSKGLKPYCKVCEAAIKKVIYHYAK